MRACEAVEEQMAAEAVAEGNGTNAKDGAEADDDVRSNIHEGYGRQAAREGVKCGGKEGGKVRINEGEGEDGRREDARMGSYRGKGVSRGPTWAAVKGWPR